MCIRDRFYAFHTGSTEYDLDEREKLFTRHLNVILEDCKKKGVILVNNDARNISTVQMLKTQAEHQTDELERWPTENLLSFNENEVHHMIPVDKGGSNDQDNLVLTKKKLNRLHSNN